MKKLTPSGVNLIRWIGIIAVLLLLVGCSRFGDVLGPQSSNNTEAASGTFEPVIYDYPEAANYAPEGYQLINIHVKAVGRLDGGCDGDNADDDYDIEWSEEVDGQLFRGVAKWIPFNRGGKIKWDGSRVDFKKESWSSGEGLWATMVRTEPPEPWIDYGPHGTQFSIPVTLRISYANCVLPEGVEPEDLVLFYWNDVTGEYELISERNNLEEQFLEGQTNHFSRYIVAATG
ncbi:hypothetical protein KKG05_11600 [bacterium]|nr:hypothetical protein [bacterium]